MAEVIVKFERTLRAAGIPIVGVSMGNTADRETWTVFYDPTATAQQRAQGDSIRATFDPNDPAVIAADLEAAAVVDVDTNKAIQATVMVLFKYLVGGQTRPTLPALGQEIKAKYKTL